MSAFFSLPRLTSTVDILVGLGHLSCAKLRFWCPRTLPSLHTSNYAVIQYLEVKYVISLVKDISGDMSLLFHAPRGSREHSLLHV